MKILRTHGADPHFKQLVNLLDAELALRDGDEHAFYHQFNGIEHLNHCLIVYINEQPVACGAFKQFDAISVEIKRMYTLKECRGQGLATLLLKALEQWVKEEGYTRCVLETGLRLAEAVALYEKNGYTRIANYGQYVGIANSVCFSKNIQP